MPRDRWTGAAWKASSCRHARWRGASRHRCSRINKASTCFRRSKAAGNEVWAQAVGYETARAEVTVEATRQAHQTFTLNTIQDVTPQLSGSEWMSALPQDTKEQRRMKEIFRTNCTACHGPTHALQNRFDENGWRAVIMFMERNSGYGRNQPSHDHRALQGRVGPVPGVRARTVISAAEVHASATADG